MAPEKPPKSAHIDEILRLIDAVLVVEIIEPDGAPVYELPSPDNDAA